MRLECSPVGFTVNGAPVILTQPSGQTNYPGNFAFFSVTATGTSPLSYQWLKNGINLTDGGNVSGARTSCVIEAGAVGRLPELSDAAGLTGPGSMICDARVLGLHEEAFRALRARWGEPIALAKARWPHPRPHLTLAA